MHTGSTNWIYVIKGGSVEIPGVVTWIEEIRVNMYPEKLLTRIMVPQIRMIENLLPSHLH